MKPEGHKVRSQNSYKGNIISIKKLNFFGIKKSKHNESDNLKYITFGKGYP